MGATMDQHDSDRIRHLVVLGHPAARSFNRSVALAYCEAVHDCGQEPVVRDLYAMGFDPLLKAEERPGTARFAPAPDVEQELELLRGAAAITLIYPIWFGMPPAIVKGYVDRVLGAGFVARALKQGTPHPLLHGKRLAQFTTSASTRPWLEERGQWSGMRAAFDTYLATIFGLTKGEHVHFDAIVDPLSPAYAEECLGQVRERTRVLCSELLNEWHRERQRRTPSGATH
jgi:NAD(P)H dehydrogenase (quinone)